MCGIAGFAGFEAPGLVERMCQAITHRGPDDAGYVELGREKITLGMRRLSIIDIEGGAQPMAAAKGRVQLVYNGEIYNHRELRAELEAAGHSFTTHCDTEVVLAAYLEWGEAAWPRLNGMFAIALADARNGRPRLIVVRDRFGIKPLYYHSQPGKLVFASELKALLCWDGLPRDISDEALWNYLSLRYVPGPGTMFTQTFRLMAGHEMTFEDGRLSLRRWWSPPPADSVDPAMTAEAARDLLGGALTASVRRHLIADVPVGTYLSGGIDSTVISALAADAVDGPLHTFSVGFPDFPHNELEQAAATAKHLGSDHRAIECRAADMGNLEDMVAALDDPFGDAIVVPMYALAREARKTVKVVLSGEGADEILGGYVFHRNLLSLEKVRRTLPGFAQKAIPPLFRLVPLAVLEHLFDYPGKLGVAGKAKLARFLDGAAEGDITALNRRLITLFDGHDISGIGAASALRREDAGPLVEDDAADGASGLQRLINMQFRDWLPDEILAKYDRMSMAHSLEGRVPFMDDRVLDAVARIPDRHKLAAGANKKVLRDFAATILPKHLLDRPKKAFYTPLESYARAPEFQDVMRRVLDSERIRKRGLFKPERVRALFEAPESDGFLPLKQGFALIMLELWFERFCPDATWK